jgi:hypothetical protein
VLRNKALSLARDLQTSLDEAKQRKVKADKQTLIARARALDERLATWEENLADDWKFEQIEFESIQSNESDFSHENFIFGIFGNVAHHYPSIWQATLWNQYRTARIAVNIIIARALFRILSEDGMNGRSHILALQERAQSEIKTQVDQLCASFPFFFGLFDNKNQRRTITAEEMKAAITRRTASTAFLLVWPITIASAAAEIPEEQKRWIKSKIVLLGRLTGNRILEVAATVIFIFPIVLYVLLTSFVDESSKANIAARGLGTSAYHLYCGVKR